MFGGDPYYSRSSGLIPGSERSPGEGNDYPLWYPCLENSMDRGAWVANSWTQLRDSMPMGVGGGRNVVSSLLAATYCDYYYCYHFLPSGTSLF